MEMLPSSESIRSEDLVLEILCLLLTYEDAVLEMLYPQPVTVHTVALFKGNCFQISVFKFFVHFWQSLYNSQN